MDFADFPVSTNDLDRRIDKIIRIFMPEASLSLIYKDLRKGLIKVNGKKIKEDYRVQEGDVVNIASFLLESNSTKTEQNQNTNIKLELPEIVFQNQHILILNKPYDTLVHGSDTSLDKAVTAWYKNTTTDTSLSFTPGPLHRLDRKTTGLITFSLSLNGAHWFSDHIKDHSIQKYYAAIVEGNLTKQEEWNDYIFKDENQKSGFKTVKASSTKTEDDEKLASTTVTPLASGKYNGKPVTLVQLNIHTGRTHQIRAQSSLHGHPLLGDTAYGGTKLYNQKQDFYLQAYCLEIPENPLELPSQIKINLNSNFTSILNVCGIRNYGL